MRIDGNAYHPPGPPHYVTPARPPEQPDAADEGADLLELSGKAGSAQDEMAKMEQEAEMLKKRLEDARNQGDAAASALMTKMKCLVIAMRIIAGDEVPQADYRYLAKNDIELFSKAVSLRVENEHPKKHKRLSEEEESTGGVNGMEQAAGAEAGAETPPDGEAVAVKGEGGAEGSAEAKDE